MASRLASKTLIMANKVLVEETDKKIEFLTDILYRFHRFGNVKMPIVRENQGLVPFLDETSSGVMNFKDAFLSSSKSSGELYKPATLWRAGV